MATLRQGVDGNHDLCPICKRDPQSCPHPLSAMTARVWENWVRGLVRDEIKRAALEG